MENNALDCRHAESAHHLSPAENSHSLKTASKSRNGAQVNAWSSEFDPSSRASEAEKLVERRFDIFKGPVVSIYEETGESIARHLWYVNTTLLNCGNY
jgi:hypothetical protein